MNKQYLSDLIWSETQYRHLSRHETQFVSALLPKQIKIPQSTFSYVLSLKAILIVTFLDIHTTQNY